MNTPITDFVKKYRYRGVSRLHMPGHKGKKMLGAEPFDITEIDGADVLYSGNGIIDESQQNAASLFGTAASLYSTEGSTLSIKAMLATVTDGVSCRQPYILAARNVHKAFVYACAMLDIDVEWLYGSSGSLCECEITAEMLESSLKSATLKPDAVYVTSPDYLGNMLDIAALSKVCKTYGVPLLVDNAHGAYLKFLKPSRHPIDLGAAMCADSAHKTLPVLTGGGYLHISKDYSEYAEIAAKKLPIFASTSPSYLILQSLDLCNKYLSAGYEKKLENCIKRVERLKKILAVDNSEPLKITLNTAQRGYTGEELVSILRQNKIEPEFYDNSHIVLMVTPENTARDFVRLRSLVRKITAKPLLSPEDISLPTPKKVMTIRSAVLAKSETVAVEEAIGKICAAPTVSCPPAIPVVISGEKITKHAAEIMKKYGINNIEVIKDAK